MNTNTYFWEKFSSEETKKWLQYKLVFSHDCDSLNSIYDAIAREYQIPIDTAQDWINLNSRNSFLSHLLPLLREGKLKVKVRDLVRIPCTDEQKIVDHLPLDQDFFLIDSVKDHTDLSPERAIDMIRTKWNALPTSFTETERENWTPEQHRQSDDLRNFEEWGVFFTLPENEWTM